MSKVNITPTNFGKLRPYCSVESIAYLKQSLNVLRKGNAPTPSFPLYGKRDVSILEDARPIIQKRSNHAWLAAYESSREGKWGPQGGVPSWDKMEENFILYQKALKDVKYVDNEIIREMCNEYKKLHCSQLSALDALDHLKRSDKIETRAAGWSEYQLKKTDPLAQKIALKYAKSGDWRKGYGYVFGRYNKLKYRIFMPMPFSSMIQQARWYIPFLGNIQRSLLELGANSPFVLWADKIGFDHCFDIMQTEINNANLQNDERIIYFSNDFEKMDTRTGTSQYRSFLLPVLHAAFGNTDMDDAIMFTTQAPIISPAGTMVGDHGTASGAEMTNGGETVCNDYTQRRLLKILKKLLPSGWRCVVRRANGDDSSMIFFVKKSIKLEDFEGYLKEALKIMCEETGFDVQTEKLDISEQFGKYCQNVFDFSDKKLFWCYPLTLVLNSIMNPEREYKKKDWDKDYRDIDIVQKLDNAVNHPNYTDFVDWVMKGMKFPLLGSNESETQRILSKYDKYRALQSLGERYNRADWKLSDSPTVNYILSKRA